MNCQKCGADIGDKKFCPQCGTPSGQAPVNQAPAYQAPVSPAPVQQTQGSPTKVLVLGILGLALSGGIVGLILAIIGLVQGNRYIAQYGKISKQVNVGRKLAIAGIIVGILVMILCIVGCIVLVANWPQIEAWLRENANSTYEIKIHY